MRNNSKHYDVLREYCETIAIIDTHDHTSVCGPKYVDPIQVIVSGYFNGELHKASSDEDMAVMKDATLSLEQRWPILEKAWKRTSHTGYAQVTVGCSRSFMALKNLAWLR